VVVGIEKLSSQIVQVALSDDFPVRIDLNDFILILFTGNEIAVMR